MSLESTATYVDSLNIAWPDGGDQRSTGDDHIRLIKGALKRTFPSLTGAISRTQIELDNIGSLSFSLLNSVGIDTDRFGYKRTTEEISASIVPVSFIYPWGDTRRYGFSLSASDGANATAIQHAIDSNAPDVLLPPGAYSYSTGITIDRAIRFRGSGSCGGDSNATGQPGNATTKLTYTGSSSAITLVGSGTEGKENIHLSDFSLWGTSSATDGIVLGTSTLITKSSLRNVHVRGFTKSGAMGVRLAKCLETHLENVYTQFNYDGIGNKAGDVATTISMISMQSRTNDRYGSNFSGTFEGGSIVLLANEGNQSAGLNINNALFLGNNFYALYSEANNQSLGTAPIIIGGGATKSNFFGGSITDAVGGLSIDIDLADRIAFYDMALTTYNTGFLKVTANSSDINFHSTTADVYPSNVTGNLIGRCKVHSGARPAHFRKLSFANAATTNLPFAAGIIFLTDCTNKKSALFSLNGSLHTATEWLDPATAFSAASGTASMINIDYSGGYYVQNNSGGTIDLLVTAINTDFIQ